jgi:hypothetical protein
MSEAEKRLILALIVLGLLCLTILYVFLFISLWAYKEAVGLSLLVVLGLIVAVYLRGKLNEQDLRWSRIRHSEEIPLDGRGEPRYLPAGAQPNPHRMPAAQPSQYYHPSVADSGQELAYRSNGGGSLSVSPRCASELAPAIAMRHA